MRDKAKELEEKQKGMKKKVNTKVINMLDGAENCVEKNACTGFEG